MNKSVLYISLLFSLIILLSISALYRFYHFDIVLEKNGLQFARIDVNEVALPHGEPIVFVITDDIKGTRKLYKFDGYGPDHQKDFHTYTIPNLSLPLDDYYVNAINGQLVFEDTLVDLSTTEIIELVSETKNIDARQLVQYTFEPGLFGFIDDSPFIFLLFSIIAFLGLWFLDAFAAILKYFFHRDGSNLIHAILLVLLAFLVSTTNPPWFPSSPISIKVRAFFFIVVSFLVFKYLNAKYFYKLDFPDRELAKFITLFFGTCFFLFIGNRIGMLIDGNQFAKVMKGHPATVEIGFIFVLSFTNLGNNIRKHLRYLSGNEKLLKASKKEVLASKAELDALQASVNPHFLYNALNAIAGLAQTDGSKTEKMALSLSSFYQYVTNKEQQHLSSFEEEIKMIENYLEIEKIRFGEKLKIDIQYSQAALPCKLPRFILQPIIENAIKYGYNPEGIFVKIHAIVHNEELNIKIIDGGKAFDDSLTSGYGLKSVAKKLRLLFPDKHQLEFINKPEKQVSVRIKQN